MADPERAKDNEGKSGLFSIAASADTVVVVDDDEGILRLAKRLMRGMGLRCKLASSAAQALELTHSIQPAAVLVDYQMPDVDGIRILRQVGDVSPGSVRVLMTAHADQHVLERALNEAHAELYLPKPFSTKQLREVVGRALRRAHRTRQGEALLASTSAERLQLDAIARAQRQILMARNPHEAFEVLLQGALEVTCSQYGFIGETEQDAAGNPMLHSLAISDVGWDEETRQSYAERGTGSLLFRNLNTLFGATLRAREVVIANDPASDPRAGGVPLGHPPLQSFLGIPFTDRGKLVGMVGVANRPGGYTPELVETLQPFVQTCTTLILRQASEREAQRVSQKLAHARLRLQATFDAALDGLLLASSEGVIRQVNPALCDMLGYESHALVGRRLDVFASVRERDEYRVLLDRHAAERATPGLRFRRRIQARHASGREFPIELSMVSIDDPAEGHSLAGTVRDLTGQLRQEQAVAEANAELARANEELRRLARTDGLTGLCNRRHFDELFHAELHRSLRSGQSFALALCDVDHFKELNDRLGHQAGDEYLVKLARILEDGFRRSGEVVARWGGEEFALLVPHVPTLAEAQRVGLRALSAVRRGCLWRPRCATGERLSVSVGVAWCEAGAFTADELLRAADAALYEAKSSGRDRACVAPPTAPDPRRNSAG